MDFSRDGVTGNNVLHCCGDLREDARVGKIFREPLDWKEARQLLNIWISLLCRATGLRRPRIFAKILVGIQWLEVTRGSEFRALPGYEMKQF